MTRSWTALLASVAALVTIGCDGGGSSSAPDVNTPDASADVVDDTGADAQPTLWDPIAYDPSERPPEVLGETGLVRWDPERGELEHHPDLVPYDLGTPLFSDYALKERALWVPDGETLTYRPDGLLGLPVGTVILKSFLFPADLRAPDEDVRLLETRLLVHTDEGWEAWPYLWREDGSEADRFVSGKVLDIDFVDREGDERSASYLVPQRNQCLDCHQARAEDGSGDSVLVPIGTTARNMNRTSDYGAGPENQLAFLAEQGKLADLPALEEVDAAFDWRALARPVDEVAADVAAMDDATVERAARDYLDVNCAHCHQKDGVEGVSSQLFLDHETTDPFELGVCKAPGSAGKGGDGRKYDIVPGDPDASILYFRSETENPGAMMPDIGRSLAHDQGLVLLREWIARMPGSCE